MNTPKSFVYKIDSIKKDLVVSDPAQLIMNDGIPSIDGGPIKHNGKTVKLVVRYDNKPELAAQVEAWKAAWQVYDAWKAAEFERNVPGLDELRSALDAADNDQMRYQHEFDRMMDRGSVAPRPVDESIRTTAGRLAEQYPRAAMYLRAKSFTYASNHHKYGAGTKAMEIIATGGSLDEAADKLNNWLPETAFNN